MYDMQIWELCNWEGGGLERKRGGGVPEMAKKAKKGQKRPKNPEKPRKNPKIHPFLTLFGGVLSQMRFWGVFLADPRKPDFRIGGGPEPANLDSLW